MAVRYKCQTSSLPDDDAAGIGRRSSGGSVISSSALAWMTIDEPFGPRGRRDANIEGRIQSSAVSGSLFVDPLPGGKSRGAPSGR